MRRNRAVCFSSGNSTKAQCCLQELTPEQDWGSQDFVSIGFAGRRPPVPDRKSSGDLLPEGGIARGEQRVFSGSPAHEMVGLGMRNVVLARLPDFVKQVGRRAFCRTVKIIAQAAVFFACGTDERAKLR